MIKMVKVWPTHLNIGKEVVILVTQRDIADPINTPARGQGDVVHIDASLVAHLLSLSHEQRIDAHELARELVNDLMQAGKEYYARQSQGPT
jgi:hypothetical protein